MMGDVIEISPSPELEPRTFYRPLRRKRIPLSPDDGNESAIELTDSTDSQRSTPCRRVKRFKEAAEPTAGPSTSSRAPVEQSSPRVIMRKHKRGQTPASRQASAVASRRPASPVQKPHVHSTSVVGQEQGVIPARPLTPPATPDSPQLVNRQLTPPPDVPPVHEQLQEPRRKETFVAAESHERLVERVREVVPDVLPAHVFELLASHEATFADNLLNAVIHVLLEDRSYPRDVKGKGKARAPEERTTEASGDVNTSVDYSQLGGDRRLGPTYRSLSLNNLRCNFPDLDQAFIRETLSLHEGHYAPTYLYLLGHGATPASIVSVPPSLRKRKSKVGSKSSLDEEEFVKEHTWLVEKLENQHSPLPGIISQDVEGEGEGIECGCCFSSYPFSKMAQCAETHLFCTNCVTSYASAKLGEQNADLHCMDISGCKMAFPDSELRRVLPEKLFELYEHIRQRRDIELAKLEGLEECPFCDYKVVMDADFQADKVLRCQNEECGKVSCRQCKKEDHLPKSCGEMEKDKKLDGKHAIEEAMTRALMRNCPSCQKAFVKEYGCNKVTCSYCMTMSCYVCRSIIRGYDHFDRSQSGYVKRGSSSSKLCPLWDNAEDRHTKEVAAAADKALKEYKTLHPDVQDEDIRVELPPLRRGPEMGMQHPRGGAGQFPPPPAYVQVHHARNAHVPIAHPVVALPFPAVAAPPFNPNPGHFFARGPQGLGLGQLGGQRPPLPRQEAPAMHPMPVPQQYNPLPAPPFPMPPLPRPPLQRVFPPMQVVAVPAGPRRVSGRARRTRG